MGKSKPLAYWDTSIVILFVELLKITPDMKHRLDKILYDYKIAIPQSVWGETVPVIIKKGYEELIPCMERFIAKMGKINFDLEQSPPVTNEIIRIAQELFECSDVINNADALILAHVIANENVTHFFTTDKAMNNSRVQDYISELVKNGKRKQQLTIVVIDIN